MHWIILLLLTLSFSIQAELVKIATWNIENLDGYNRSTEDYERLFCYATRLNADIIALQEVSGEKVAKLVFDAEEYNFYFSSRDHAHKTGFAVRKDIKVVQHADYQELGLGNDFLRYGTDISVFIQNQEIRLLSIHLKSFCFDNDLDSYKKDCKQLKQQSIVLETWIDARANDNIPFIVLGDFNRRFDKPSDTFWPDINDFNPKNAELTRPTENKISQCLDAKYPLFVDHIVLDKLSTQWYLKDSFEQLLFKDFKKYNLSDHCPIAIYLNIEQEKLDTKALLEKIQMLEKEMGTLKQMLQ